jgi:hypothetical protein
LRPLETVWSDGQWEVGLEGHGMVVMTVCMPIACPYFCEMLTR